MTNTCTHASIVTDDVTGETVCCGCGRVMSDPGYGEHAPATSYEPGSSKTFGKHTGTKIGECDHTGQKIGGYGWLKMRDMRAKPNRQNEVRAVIMLRGACDKLGLPERVQNNAIDIINAGRKLGLTRGLPVTAAAAGALFVACRQEGIPRTLAEIAKTLNARLKLASSASGKIRTLLNLRIEPPDASSYIPRILSEIGAGEVVGRKAREMFAVFKELHLDVSKKPTSFVAAVIYMACIEAGKPVAQSKIAKAAGVTDVGMRNNIRRIKEGCAGIKPPTASISI